MSPKSTKSDDLSTMTLDELETENEHVMAERAKAERGFKERSAAIQEEINHQTASAAVDKALEGLPPKAREAVLSQMKRKGTPNG